MKIWKVTDGTFPYQETGLRGISGIPYNEVLLVRPKKAEEAVRALRVLASRHRSCKACARLRLHDYATPSVINYFVCSCGTF